MVKVTPKPKAVSTTKPKSSAAPKAKPKTKKSLSPPPSPPRTAVLDKNLVCRIILAKLDESKTCDWYALSQKLAAEDGGNGVKTGIITKAGTGKGGKGNAKGKNGKNGKNSNNALSGSDLHDLYHNKILPGLRAGRALWRESPPPDARDTYESLTPSDIIGSEVDRMVKAARSNSKRASVGNMLMSSDIEEDDERQMDEEDFTAEDESEIETP
ncbi:uncharacterized protein EHS24_002781 [Apiotrichum porosum]|uniref:Uncharacterized protein n=1 Tax=Apiotrichum porosum TaxID=105984 RepID=A0A427XHK9_9TREE|nr:uncharacterized protein EHS24_002781 [Apiotrichum porosum]RSH78312.1 hypothetical protein EHS24_002781 [Apiotrichum porosum]